MSGGHWDYRHGSAASQYEGGVGVHFINEVVDEVNRDIANPLSGEFADATEDQRAAASEGTAYLESVSNEIEKLCHRLAELVGHDSKVYEIIDSLDRLYSGDISHSTNVYRIREALGTSNHDQQINLRGGNAVMRRHIHRERTPSHPVASGAGGNRGDCGISGVCVGGAEMSDQLTDQQRETLARAKARKGKTTPAPWAASQDHVLVDGNIPHFNEIVGGEDKDYVIWTGLIHDDMIAMHNADFSLITDAPNLDALAIAQADIIQRQAARIALLENELRLQTGCVDIWTEIES